MHLFLVTYLHNKCFSGDLLGLNSLLYVFLSVTQRRFYFDIFSLWNTFIYIGSCAPVEIPSSTIVFYGHKVEVGRNIRSASAFKCKRKSMQNNAGTQILLRTHLRRGVCCEMKRSADPLARRPCHMPRATKEYGFLLFLRISVAFIRCSGVLGAKFKHFAIQAAPSLIVVPRYFCCKTASENKHLNENEKYV